MKSGPSFIIMISATYHPPKLQGVGSAGEKLGIKWCAPSWSQD
jgi:hypothetical protein